MPSSSLHPNLAKLAAAYDDILRRLAAGQLTASAANTEIAQLEARDDDGVRWSIDPGTGQWVRKTAFGDSEYDPAPPSSGYMTHDAFDFTPRQHVFNPRQVIQFEEVTDGGMRLSDMPAAPTGVNTGSARQPRTSRGVGHVSRRRERDAKQPGMTRRQKVLAVAAAAAIIAVVSYALTSTSEGDFPTPPGMQVQATSPADAAPAASLPR